MLIKEQGDLASSAEFVPGYSSFLFNQLLQTQFYSVNHGGLSININLDRNNTNTLPTTKTDSNVSLSPLIAAEPHVITSSPTHAHRTTTSTNTQTTSTVNNAKPVENVSMKKEVNSVQNQYKSGVFQQVLAKQKDNYNKYFDNETRVHIPVYPEIDLEEFFGEKELIHMNKRRLQSLLYDSWCNLGTNQHTFKLILI